MSVANYLYTSSILTSPVLARHVGAKAKRDNISHDLITTCIDPELSPAIQFGLNGGDAHIIQTAAAFTRLVNHQDYITDSTLRTVSGNSQKQPYNYWVIGHHDCKWVESQIIEIRNGNPEAINRLTAILGKEDGEAFIEAINETSLSGTDLQNAVSAALVLKSAANLTMHTPVFNHITNGAAVIPAFKIFDRGTGANNYTRYPFVDSLCLYKPEEMAFVKAQSFEGRKPVSWVSGLSDRKHNNPSCAHTQLKRGFDGFVQRIKSGETEGLIIGA
jgi:carbonic anhydrase